MKWRDALDRLAGVSAGQRGFFTRAQAVRLGVDDFALGRATRAGLIDRDAHGLYRIVGAHADPTDQAFGAWLRLNPKMNILEELRHPTTVLTGATALDAWGMGDLAANTIDFVTTSPVRTRDPNVKLTRRKQLGQDMWRIVNGFPVARPHYAATYALKHGQGDLDQIARAVHDAITNRLVTLDEAARVLKPALVQQGLDSAARAELLSTS